MKRKILNCSGEVSRDRDVTTAFSICPGSAGWPPIWPAATCVFCAWIALMVSMKSAVRPASRSGCAAEDPL